MGCAVALVAVSTARSVETARIGFAGGGAPMVSALLCVAKPEVGCRVAVMAQPG